MNFNTYIFIGSIYSLVTLLYNMFVAKNDYNDSTFSLKFGGYILDLFLWPLGIVTDVLVRLKRARK